MNRSERLIITILIVLFSLLDIVVAKADVGPKPTMQMKLVFQGPPIAILKVDLLECQVADCADGKPLQQLGPQRIQCSADSCFSSAYGYSPFHKLVITFADRIRESNVFTKRAFDAQYTIAVSEISLTVEETFIGSFGDFVLMGGNLGLIILPSLIVTIVVETLIAVLYLVITRQSKRLLLWVPVINLITLPILWLFVTTPILFNDSVGGWKLLIGEIAVVIVEAVFLRLISRKKLTLKHAVIMSIVMNGMSFLAGYLLAVVGL